LQCFTLSLQNAKEKKKGMIVAFAIDYAFQNRESHEMRQLEPLHTNNNSVLDFWENNYTSLHGESRSND
jgi:hypothetical protein